MSQPRIDFKAIAAASLNAFESLLNEWLPSGKRYGSEFKSVNPTRGDSKPGSFSININSGVWSDFATDDAGSGAIDLYMYLFGCDAVTAAKEIAARLGISSDEPVHRVASAQAGHGVKSAPAEQKKANWVPVMPVPDNAPDVPLAHIKRGKPDAAWKYCDESGALLGYIWRFTTSDGGKEIVPFTYCRHESTGAHEWRNIQFSEPRPLYVPLVKFREGVTKLIVEGEKCADAAVVSPAMALRFDVVTWPGGGKAIGKVDWSRFVEGDKVILWPDCDAQLEKLTREEVAAGVDPSTKPILPEQEQPGVMTMEKIAQILTAQGCIVRIVKIPAPGEKPSGWDVADAVAEGMTGEEIIQFVIDNLRAPAFASTPEQPSKPISTASRASAEDWDSRMFLKNGAYRECRENVFEVLAGHPDWKGCLALDEFSNSICVRRDTPTGLKAGGLWDEDQDFNLGLWLARHLHLFIKAESMLGQGVRAAAVAQKFHPVRNWLDGLSWDGVPRLADWLSDFAGVQKSEYTALVGRYFLIGMVARIYRPGCKMDTALILEGLQGEGKSTIAKALAGEWFSDTTFVMGDKDSFLALRGKWAYELAELDSFNRSESTRAKAFISSSVDSYRAPYDRVSKDWPRQCVFIGTTNQYEYFKDASGNRRYWPVHCTEKLDAAGLREVRELLFAEAVQLFREGAKHYPSRDEQDRLFTPEQEAREIADPWESAIFDWAKTCPGEVTALDVLCGALKMEVSKIDGAKQAAMRVGVCMRKLGWPKKRRSGGAREWVYVRPAETTKTFKFKSQIGGQDGVPI